LIKTEKILSVSVFGTVRALGNCTVFAIAALFGKLTFLAAVLLSAMVLPAMAQVVTTGAATATVSASVSPIRIASITPVKRQAVGAGLYNYSYQVALSHVSNGTNGAYSIKAVLSSTDARYAVQSGQVNLEVLPSSAVKVSYNQITVRAPVNFDSRFDSQGNLILVPSGSLAQPMIESNAFVWKFKAENDTSAPEIKDLRSELIGDDTARKVVIQASYSDTDAGIDTAGVKLRVNGLDVTTAARITLYGLEYAANHTIANSYTVELEVADRLGNKTSKTTTIKTDELSAKFNPSAEPISAAPSSPLNATGTSSLDVAPTNNNAASAVATPTPGVVLTGIQQVIPQAANPTNTNNPAPPVAPTITNTTLGVQVASPGALVEIITPQANAVFAADALPAIKVDISGGNADWRSLVIELDGKNIASQIAINANSVSYNPSQALQEGTHTLRVSIKDKLGNTNAQTVNFKTATPPAINGQTPKDTQLPAGSVPTIAATLSDVGSGIDTSQVKLFINGVEVSLQAQISVASISYAVPQALSAGTYQVKLMVSDKAGNTTTNEWQFDVAKAVVNDPGPILTITNPAANAVLAADALPQIKANFSDAVSGINQSGLVVELDGQNITAQVSTSATDLSYTAAQALPEGSHTLRISVASTSGKVNNQTVNFNTATPPVITVQTPKDTFLPSGATPVIAASYSDLGSGIDTSQVKLFLSGTDVSAQSQISANVISYAVPQALPDATHQVKLTVADKAGNTTTSEWQFGTAQPPLITANTPKDVLLSPGSRPTISASYSDARSGINTSSVRLIVNSDDVTALSQVTASGVSYTPAQPLAAGPYTIYLEVANTTNAAANAVWGFEVDEAKIYNVTITSPAGAQSVITSKVTVTAAVSANKTYATRVTVGGVDMQLTGSTPDGASLYSGSANLIDGVNTLNVVATYADGQSTSTSAQVSYDAPPRLTILSPADKAVFGSVNPGTNTPGGATNLTGNVERPVTVTGRLSKPVASVTVNQQQATLEQGGLAFSFPNFFLREGTNMVTAVATDANGRVVSSAITVNVDQTAPILRIEAPDDKAITSNAKIDIRGMVNDAVEALHGAPEPTVSVNVNGQTVTTGSAQVSDRYFTIPEVPLQIGANTLRITATDHLGNARVQDIQVNRITVGSDRLTLLGGNRQTAPINTELAKPLQVVALNAQGEPLANLPISFDVLRGSGSISTAQGVPTILNGLTAARNLSITTDQFGRAQVWHTVGKQTGPGANVVKASNPALGEEVTFTASTQRGAVAKINADLGTNQIAETNAQPLELLSLVVRDASDNVLPNVQVVFTIEEGDASFPDTTGVQASANPNGQDTSKPAQRIILSTDKNGLVALRPQIGNTAGLVRIKAQALKLETGNVNTAADLTGNASFLIQAKAAADGPASFTGQIFDDKSKPLAGIKVSIGRTALVSTTDEQGKFELANIPPGRIDLFIDGRTYNPTQDAARAQYPSLHFEAYAVKGTANQLAHPIYLPPLATSTDSAKVVGGSQDTILTIPGLAGFQMKIKANSVTFPDGSKTGLLIVSPVTADKLPMAPPAGGATFGVPAWTIQPAGTRFDPPIEVTLPNTRAYPAGDNIPIVQWDHDLAQYVPMGRATVSEDGAVLITDSGSGLTKAGWGGACVYDPDKCGKKEPCDPKKCLTSDGECGCKDADNKCKDGPEITGSWEVPKEVFEKVTQKVSEFSKVNPWFELSASVSPSGSFKAKFQNKCCKDAECSEPPKMSSSVSGTIGASAKFEAKIGPALIGRLEDVVGRFGTKEIAGFVASIQVGDIRPAFEVKFSGASISASGTSDTCPKGDACIGVDFNSSINMGGKWNPTVSAGIYIKKDSTKPIVKQEDGKPKLDTSNLQYLLEAKASGGGELIASGYSVKVSGKTGDSCKDSGFSSKITTGGIKAKWGYEISGKLIGMGSITFEWADEVQLVEAVSE
jgi:large repetitive protein